MAKQHIAGYPVTVYIDGKECFFIKTEEFDSNSVITQYLSNGTPLECKICISIVQYDMNTPFGNCVDYTAAVTFNDVVCKITSDQCYMIKKRYDIFSFIIKNIKSLQYYSVFRSGNEMIYTKNQILSMI